jgi:hypothetical protein
VPWPVLPSGIEKPAVRIVEVYGHVVASTRMNFGTWGFFALADAEHLG